MRRWDLVDQVTSSQRKAHVWGAIALIGILGTVAASVTLPYWTFSFVGTSELTLWELRNLSSNDFVTIGILPQFALQIGWIAAACLWAVGIAASATGSRHIGIPAALAGSAAGLASALSLLAMQPDTAPLTASRGSGLWLSTLGCVVALVGTAMYRQSLVAAITASRNLEEREPDWGPDRRVIKAESWEPSATPVVEAQPETVMAFSAPEPEPEPEPDRQPAAPVFDQAALIMQQMTQPPADED